MMAGGVDPRSDDKSTCEPFAGVEKRGGTEELLYV